MVLAPLLKPPCPARWGWEPKSAPGALPSLWGSAATGEALLCQPGRLHPAARLSAPGPVSCLRLCPRSPGALKANLEQSRTAPAGVCRSPRWLLKSEVKRLDGLRGSLWGQKRALRALWEHLVPQQCTQATLVTAQGRESFYLPAWRDGFLAARDLNRIAPPLERVVPGDPPTTLSRNRTGRACSSVEYMQMILDFDEPMVHLTSPGQEEL